MMRELRDMSKTKLKISFSGRFETVTIIEAFKVETTTVTYASKFLN